MSQHDPSMAMILLEMELLSFGATQSFNKSGGGSSDPTDRIVGQVLRLRDPRERPLHLHYRELYDRQHSDIGRKAVRDEADAELKAAQKRPEPPKVSISFDRMVVEDGEGWPAEVVAQRFRIDPAFVRRIRAKANRSMESGLPLIAMSVSDPAGRAVELRAEGFSTREIATELDMSQSQVMRYIRNAA